MSYSRSYHSSVRVSGAKTVRYPASQTGGSLTVSYDETVPVDIDIFVDTDPFDRSVNETSRNVSGLTASVVAMNGANCAAIMKSAEKISESLINGFYSLVQSDVSMKKSESSSQLQAKAALLMELSKDVSDKHVRMSSDMERLHAHYSAIFRDLDSELEKRMRDIDRPAFSIAEKIRNGVIMEPCLTAGAETADRTMTDSGRLSGITAARLRSKVSGVLKTMGDSIRKNVHYRKVMHDTLWNESAETEKEVYVPVAYFVFDSTGNGGLAERCYACENISHDAIVSKVGDYVRSSLSSEGNDLSEEEMMFIDQAFSSMVESSFISQDNSSGYNERVYAEILRMWQSNKASLKKL